MLGQIAIAQDEYVIAPPGSPEYWPTAAMLYNEQTAYGRAVISPVDESAMPDTPIPGFNDPIPGFNGLGQVSDTTKSWVVYGAIGLIGLSVLFWFSRRK